MLKLGSNECPLGPSAAAIECVQSLAAKLHLYPDDAATGLKGAIAQTNGLEPDQIILGTGSDEVIAMALHAYCNPDAGIVTALASFPMYGICAQGFGAPVHYRPLQNHCFDLNSFADALPGQVVCIADPNNPTGTTIDFNHLLTLVRQYPETLFLYDAAYEEYRPRPQGWRWDAIVNQHPNLFVTRTFSKAYGLAGLRVGYGYGHIDVVRTIQRVRPPFNVNSLALAAAKAALGDISHLQAVLDTNLKALTILEEFCQKFGLDCIPSQANFMLIRVPQISVNTSETVGQVWARRLLDRDIIVRALPGIGYDDWLRISTGTLEQTQHVCATLAQLITGQ